MIGLQNKNTLSNKKILLVSGADANYYQLLSEMIDSVGKFSPFQSLEVAVFDLGLESYQVKELEDQEIIVKKPLDLDGILPKRKKLKAGILAAIGKITLPKQFPGYDIYIWVDADIWFQSPLALQHFAIEADKGKMAVVPTIDHCYIQGKMQNAIEYRQKRINQLLGLKGRILQFIKPNRELEQAKYYYLNGGIFALSATAPHWTAMSQCYRDGLLKGSISGGLIQTCSTLMFIKGDLPFHPFPSRYNWLCHRSEPIWDEKESCYVTPLAPHEKIHVVHLTADTKNNKKLRYGARLSQ